MQIGIDKSWNTKPDLSQLICIVLMGIGNLNELMMQLVALNTLYLKEEDNGSGVSFHCIQIWTGYEGNSTKYMPEGVRVDNYFTRP